MSLTVGHNDLGFEPDRSPIVVGDLNTAVQVLCNELIQWLQPVLQGEEPEFTQREVAELLERIKALRQHSKLNVQGRVFWIQ